MKLYAIADLHISYKINLDALQLLPLHPDDSLIIAGDIGERLSHLRTTFELTTQLFKQVFWVPGNHELYTLPPADASSTDPDYTLRGDAKYQACLAIANEYGVITPEDEYVTWTGPGGPAIICPLFTLYDYSFRPDDIPLDKALDWAAETDVVATDEILLHPNPYPTRIAWCDDRLAKTIPRVEAAAAQGLPLVLINHWPLRQDVINLGRIPRFSLWCGTTKTEDWHTKFQAKVVVTGHLHTRRTDWIEGTRFEEVSLGYPRQWEDARKMGRGVEDLLREILPGQEFGEGDEVTKWRKLG